jgi:hypothetical protein
VGGLSRRANQEEGGGEECVCVSYLLTFFPGSPRDPEDGTDK